MTTMRCTILFAGALALAGCKSDAPGSDATAPVAAERGNATASAMTPASAPASASTPAEEADARAGTTAPVLAVEGDGLRLVDPASGAARPIPFGTPQAETEAILRALLGRAPDERGETSDCGSRRFARWNGALSAWFGDEGFSGWSLPDGSALATVSGLRLGSPRSELALAYSAEVMPSSLGTEFVAGTLGGVLDTDAPDAVVTHLWAGDTCIAR